MKVYKTALTNIACWQTSLEDCASMETSLVSFEFHCSADCPFLLSVFWWFENIMLRTESGFDLWQCWKKFYSKKLHEHHFYSPLTSNINFCFLNPVMISASEKTVSSHMYSDLYNYWHFVKKNKKIWWSSFIIHWKNEGGKKSDL